LSIEEIRRVYEISGKTAFTFGPLLLQMINEHLTENGKENPEGLWNAVRGKFKIYLLTFLKISHCLDFLSTSNMYISDEHFNRMVELFNWSVRKKFLSLYNICKLDVLEYPFTRSLIRREIVLPKFS
jgi:hypothetical protein